MAQKRPDLAGTWPLFEEAGTGATPFPAHPQRTLSDSAPPEWELTALDARTEFPESNPQTDREVRRMRESLPPTAPEWMRAARALADWLERRIASGTIDPVDQATLARSWAAWSLAGASEAHVLRVAHLVGRAHTALREQPRQRLIDAQAALNACAGVLHGSLPSALKDRMPMERVLYVVRYLYDEADHWAAIVEGTAELLGWKDYARVHAAAAIRAVIEKGR